MEIRINVAKFITDRYRYRSDAIINICWCKMFTKFLHLHFYGLSSFIFDYAYKFIPTNTENMFTKNRSQSISCQLDQLISIFMSHKIICAFYMIYVYKCETEKFSSHLRNIIVVSRTVSNSCQGISICKIFILFRFYTFLRNEWLYFIYFLFCFIYIRITFSFGWFKFFLQNFFWILDLLLSFCLDIFSF